MIGINHQHVAVTISDIALLNVMMGYHSEAEEIFELALLMYDKINGRNHPSTAKVLSNMGNFYNDIGKSDKANIYFEQHYKVCVILYGPEDERTKSACLKL